MEDPDNIEEQVFELIQNADDNKPVDIDIQHLILGIQTMFVVNGIEKNANNMVSIYSVWYVLIKAYNNS
ncbi:MAG TPA: hypothetical protein EYQ06_05745 [Flavobacteriales bacterium]|nr:hypothetical protein [Flavobacteriales bacterium]